MTAEEIAKAALRLDWRNVESQARRVAEYAAEYMKAKTPKELCQNIEVRK